ncbi:MAG TPA: glycosyltransferase [Gaiellaceae bacterium]|jgi:glycosyltransferase involved in cell wall biosynthesis
MTTPPLSVVVASVNGFPYLGHCLDSLLARCPEAEIVVADCSNEETRQRVREEWPEVTLVGFEEPTSVPALRAAGIAAASAPHIAVIEDHCVVRNGWSTRLLAGHRAGRSIVGGPIRNGSTDRLRDWAGFLFEYSAYMEPGPEGAVSELLGMNVSYDRRAIAAIDDLLREGKWESWLHARLRERGFELYSDSKASLDHVKDFGFREFAAQRFHYARAFAGMRTADLGRRRFLYAFGAPTLVPLLYARLARNVLRRGRHRREFLLATPLLLVYVVVTAIGEAVGFAFGGGRSLLRVK